MGTHAKGSVSERRALDTYIKLMRAADTIAVRVKTEMAGYDLTWTQFAVLEALFHLGPLTQTDMCTKILKSGGNLTLVVNNLERDGLVTRRRCKQDRRRIFLDLTDVGRQRIAATFPEHARFLDSMLHVLTPDELEQLGHLCKKLGLATRPVDSDAPHESVKAASNASSE